MVVFEDVVACDAIPESTDMLVAVGFGSDGCGCRRVLVRKVLFEFGSSPNDRSAVVSSAPTTVLFASLGECVTDIVFRTVLRFV